MFALVALPVVPTPFVPGAFRVIVEALVVIAAIVLFIVSRILAQQPIPFLPLVLAIYLATENSVRFLINWTHSRPIGSPLG